MTADRNTVSAIATFNVATAAFLGGLIFRSVFFHTALHLPTKSVPPPPDAHWDKRGLVVPRGGFARKLLSGSGGNRCNGLPETSASTTSTPPCEQDPLLPSAGRAAAFPELRQVTTLSQTLRPLMLALWDEEKSASWSRSKRQFNLPCRHAALTHF
jgi:hypothetical protein